MVIRQLLMLLLVVSPAAVAAGSLQDNWTFRVYLGEKPVGIHTFNIEGPDNDRVLTSDAKFDVDFFIFNAYSYRHRSRERWDGDCLREIQAWTDDNGDKIAVQGATDEKEQFLLAGKDGGSKLSGCVMTFAYWNPIMLSQKRLLNPQTGEYQAVNIEPIGRDSIRVRGKDMTASHYRLKAEKFLIDLWYSADGRWLALDSTLTNGQQLRYRIE